MRGTALPGGDDVSGPGGWFSWTIDEEAGHVIPAAGAAHAAQAGTTKGSPRLVLSQTGSIMDDGAPRAPSTVLAPSWRTP